MLLFKKEGKTVEELRKIAEIRLYLTTNIKGKNFSDTITFLLDWFHMLIKEITDVYDDEGSLTYRTFLRYKENQIKNPNKRTVIAMCISMGLPFFLSIIVIENAGFAFTNTKEDSFLLMILDYCVEMRFKEINSMLISNGFESLT